MQMKKDTKQERMLTLTFIPLAIAINVALGAIVKALNMPLYVDSIGTILATLLFGWKKGAIVGVLGFALLSVFNHPFAVYFSLTQIVIAFYIDYAGRKGWFKNALSTIGTGVILGVITAVCSAPISILIFQGATGNGAALVTSFFAQMGNQIVESIFFAGFSIEPFDKILQCLLSYFLLRSIPDSLLEKFPSKSLRINHFIGNGNQ